MNNDVFISYCHDDRKWLDKLQKMLKPLLRNNPIAVWDDTKIRPGAKWKEEIEKALNNADAAILLVSPNFLASDFITSKEVPELLGSAQTNGVKIFWIPISDCLWTETDIANYQAAYSPTTPLDSLDESEVNSALVAICKEIKRALSPEPEPEEPPKKQRPRQTQQNVTPGNQYQQKIQPPPPPLQPAPAQFGGTWRSADGSYTIIRQNGTMITAESFVNVFGIATRAAWGQGAVVGNQAYIDFMDAYGNSGRTEVTLSGDGQSISGMARYNNGFVQNIFATRSL